MAYATINKPNTYFNTVTYTGDGTTPKTITGVNFKSDLTWIKRRDSGQGNTNHNLWNFISGAGNNAELSSNITGAEGGSSADLYGYVSAFTSDGFTVADGTDATYKNLYTNNNGGTYVAWNWLGSNTTTNNTAGTISSTVCANTTSGFSIVSYTGTGSNATVGHGLGVAPKMVIVKSRSNSTDWIVGNTNIGWTKLLRLNTTAAEETNNYFNDTAPTSSVFSLGTTVNVNGSGYTYVAYCFAEVKGFSKFGSYVGNGSNTDNTFVYTGFKPALLIVKDTGINSWNIMDNKMNPTNTTYNNFLFPDLSNAQSSGTYNFASFYSNGFKIGDSNSNYGGSGRTYIYAAFAENPLVGTNNIPTTAR